ncbi:MAG: nucleotidyltransferase family protein [Gemmatimonadaceae bacterium]|nr:nucleotidyltransferase family protein [Gemmatimonadaceae bacterium]
MGRPPSRQARSAPRRCPERADSRQSLKKIGAIVLAAGGSSRLGYSKQLIEFQGSPLVRRAVLAVQATGANPVVVVVGSDAEKVAVAIQDIDGITICRNTDWKSGLSSSLKAGLRAVQDFPAIDAVLVTLSDQPFISGDVLRQLVDCFTESHRLVAAEYEGVLGVPALFGKEYFDALDQLEGDAGAGSWLRGRKTEVTPVAVGGGAIDIDTASDAQKLRQHDKPRHPDS